MSTPTVIDRDYCTEMRAFIDDITDRGPYIPAIAASEIVGKLRANDPELLAGWLDVQAEQFIRMMINQRDHSRRAVVHHRAKRSAFADAAESYSNGDTTALRGFLTAPYKVESGERLPLAKLTHDDLLYVESDYRQRAEHNLMWAAFMAALAKKVRKGVVEDHFTEGQLAAMYDSIGSRT